MRSPSTQPETASPALSCIVTAYSEGNLATVAIDSILSQDFGDFELLIVDDGADEQTRAVLHQYDDPRIVHIRQANDGLSSARNRALTAARGEYVCFLDADDSRPSWAFSTLIERARATDADVVFAPGLLSELRNETLPFYDQDILRKLETLLQGAVQGGTPDFVKVLPYLVAIEPQSANKLVRRAFIDQQKLRFPAGLFFEDMVFHMALVLGLGKVTTVQVPCFTYFRRYARPQITGGRGISRFDAISSAANALGLFRQSAYFQDYKVRILALAATFKLLQWCEESVSHHLRWQYRQVLLSFVASLDDRYTRIVRDGAWHEAVEIAPWIAPSITYFEKLVAEARR